MKQNKLMVGSTKTTLHRSHHHHHLMDNCDDHRHRDRGGADGVDEDDTPSSAVACSICLDLVLDNGGRSRAKLQCGHEFHLDCIGSAFNMKGAMQCPNCRKTEKGQWLYANGSSRPLHELSSDDWIPYEDLDELTRHYIYMQDGVHWCPFGELAGVGSFEEVESPSTTYHDMRLIHSMYAEHSTASSGAHSYVAYLGPVPPASPTPNDSVDDPNFHHHWSGLVRRSEIFDRRAIPAINVQYHSWGHRSPPFSLSSSQLSGADRASVPSMTLRSSTSELEARTRSTSFPHPILFGSMSGPTAPNSFGSLIAPHHSGSVHQSERIHMSHAFHYRHQSNNSPVMATPIIHGAGRFDGARGLPAPQQDLSRGFVIVPSSPRGLNLHAWEREQIPPYVSFDRESGWSSFHQHVGGSDSGDRSSSFWRWRSS